MIDPNVRTLANNHCCREKTSRFLRLCAAGYIGTLALLLISCGGGSKGSSSSVSNNPVPALQSLSPTSAPAGSRAVTLSVTGSSFVSGSVVRWNGTSRTTTFISGTRLTAEISPADLANSGVSQVTVFNPAPGGGTSGSAVFLIEQVAALSLLTARLPDATHNKEYSYALQASGGIKPYAWTVAAGSLPPGLSLSQDGLISGTSEAVIQDTAYDLTVQLRDDAFQAGVLTKLFSIRARPASLGRNDTCANATPVTNGVIRASISPFGDIDVYSFQGNAGARITAEIYAQRLSLYPESGGTDVFLDSFLELLDSSCSSIYYNDDIISGVSLDSVIANYTLPVSGTYYLRISDLRGDGRPDFIYDLHLAGAN